MGSKATKKVDANNINIMRAARSLILRQNIEYEDRIPVPTRENIANIYENFTKYQGMRNALVGALYGLIGAQTVRSDTWQNVFESVKKEPMRYGSTEQDIWVNMAKGYEFDSLGGADRAFAIYRAYVMNAHHHVNFWQQYGVTVTWEELQSAFLSEYGLRSLVTAKLQSLQTGANWDEYLCSLAVVQSANTAGVTYPVTVPRPVDETTTLQFLDRLLEYAGLAKFPLPQHNAAGATSSVQDASNLVLVTTPGVISKIKVYAQAYAFNYEFLTDPLKQIIVHEVDPNNPDVIANLIDIRWFNIKDHYRTVSEQYNGASLNTNHFLTISEMFSYSPYFKNFKFTTEETTVTGITVELPAGAATTKGSQTELVVTVTGTNALTTYSLELDGNTSVRTYIIPGTPILVIGADEKAATMTVTAKSLFDSSITDTLTITVPQ